MHSPLSMGVAPPESVGYTARALVRVMRHLAGRHLPLVDLLKVWLRPLTCPIGDALALVPVNARVADVGCGNGMFLALLATLRAPRALYGTEVSQRLVDNAVTLLRERVGFGDAEIELFDGFTFGESLVGYDVVTFLDVLHHVDRTRQRELVGSLATALPHGTTLIFKDIDGGRRVLSWFNKLHDLMFSGEIGHERPAREVIAWLQASGLEVHATYYRRMYGFPHYTVVCRKASGGSPSVDETPAGAGWNSGRPRSGL